MEPATNPNESESLITVEQIDEIRNQPTKIVTTPQSVIKNNLYKKIIIYSLLGLLAAFIIFLIFRPKDYVFYEKDETFSPCSTKTEICFQKIFIHNSGKIVFTGRQQKEYTIKYSSLRKIKSVINNANISKNECEAMPILVGNKVMHIITIKGQHFEILSPGCDSELEALDQAIAPYIK